MFGFFYSDDKSDKIQVINAENITVDKLRYSSPYEYFENAFLEEKGYDQKEYHQINIQPNDFEKILENTFEVAESSGFNFIASLHIRNDFSEYYKHLNKSNATLSKASNDNIYSYTHLNVDEIVEFYNSETLTVVLEQAMFCYSHNKFLAAAATLGAALEEQCAMILEMEGEEFGWREDTSLVNLTGKIRTKGIIDRRTATRLRSSASLRNAAVHTSTGYITKSDCDTIISAMKELLAAYEDFLEKKHLGLLST